MQIIKVNDQIGSLKLPNVTDYDIISLDDKVLFNKPTNFSQPLAKIKKGRVLFVEKCENNWCKIKTDKFKGWIERKNLWGKID